MAVYERLRKKAPPISVKNVRLHFPSPEEAPNERALGYLDAVDVVLSHLPNDSPIRGDVDRFCIEYRSELGKFQSQFDQEDAELREKRIEAARAGVLKYLNSQPFSEGRSGICMKLCDLYGWDDVDVGLTRLIKSGQVNVRRETSTAKENGQGRDVEIEFYDTVNSRWDRVKRMFIVHSNAL